MAVLKPMIAISVCFILLTGAAAGSDAGIEGNWMGKLGELRVVFRIAVNEDGPIQRSQIALTRTHLIYL